MPVLCVVSLAGSQVGAQVKGTNLVTFALFVTEDGHPKNGGGIWFELGGFLSLFDHLGYLFRH